MATKTKEEAIANLQKELGIRLYPFPNKRIFYRGSLPNGDEVLICTPESKIYPNGNGWIDLTTIQVGLLAEAKISILAVRLENDKVLYINFPELQPFLTKDAMLYNKREGDHWKLHIWPNRIKLLGNNRELLMESTELDSLKYLF